MPDAELLAAHIAGDRYAFEELFYRHHRQLYRLAVMTSRNPDDAADALQDALLSAHRTAGSFRRDSAVSSWLYRIVVNACLDRLRRHRSHPTTELKDDNCPIGDPTSRVDTAIVVERALMRLPVEQRAAVVAVDMHGYSVAETARMLGIAEGTVKSRCSRARAKLAEVLGYFDSRAVPDARGAMQ
jgi:RNA polymerase sigma-70 factor (ECF subfamily)